MDKERLIRLTKVKEKTGLTRSFIYSLINKGEFPKQIKLGLGLRAAGWVESEVDEWISELIKKNR